MSARPAPASSCAADAFEQHATTTSPTPIDTARRMAGGSLSAQASYRFIARARYAQRLGKPRQLERAAGVRIVGYDRQRVVVLLQLLLRAHERVEHVRVDVASVVQVDDHVVVGQLVEARGECRADE